MALIARVAPRTSMNPGTKVDPMPTVALRRLASVSAGQSAKITVTQAGIMVTPRTSTSLGVMVILRMIDSAAAIAPPD